MRRIRRFPCAAALLVLLAAGAEAGGTKADYARAAHLERAVRGTVRHARLQEVWLDAQTLCYPWTDETGRRRLLRVDLPDGKPRPAFDDAAVQPKLRQLLGVKEGGAPLAIDPAGVGGEELQAWVRGELVGIHMRTGAVRRLKLEDVPSLGLAPSFARRSNGGGRDTAITFVNRSKKTVRLVWLDHAGQQKAYGTVAPGASFRQHTFPGHVWLVRAEDGTELGSYTGQRRPAVVFVTGTPPKRPERKPARGPAWSPDGSRRAFIKDHDVHVRDAKTGKETRLSTDGSAQDTYRARFRWSPSGRYLMAIQEQPAQQRTVHVVNSVPKEQFQPTLVSYGYLKPGDRIAHPRPRLFDVQEPSRRSPVADDAFQQRPGQIRDLELGRMIGNALSVHLHRARASGACDSLRSIPRRPTARREQSIDEECKYVLRLLANRAGLSSACLARTARPDLWMSERSGWNHLYLGSMRSDRRSEECRSRSGAWVVRRGGLDVDEDARRVWFECAWACSPIRIRTTFTSDACRFRWVQGT